MPNIAFVGITHIHTPGFISKVVEDTRVQTLAVYDKDTVRAEQDADKLGAPSLSLEELLTTERIDAYVICSETLEHLPIVEKIAPKGKPIFIEKPVGFSGSDSQRIEELLKKHGNLFQTGYFMRAQPAHLFLKKAIEDGYFGTITSINMSNCHGGAIQGIFDTEYRWMADPSQCGYGGYGDLGFHSLDIMQWFLGQPDSVIATSHATLERYPGIDEYGQGLLKWSGGIVGHLRAGWVSSKNPITLEISGTEGHAHMAQGKLFFSSQNVEGADGQEAWTSLPDAEPHPFQTFLDHLCGDSSNPLIPLGDATKVDLTMEAFYESMETLSWVKTP